jgi:hypothetical protein
MTHPFFEINKIDQTRDSARDSWIGASIELFPEGDEVVEPSTTEPELPTTGSEVPSGIPTGSTEPSAEPTTGSEVPSGIPTGSTEPSPEPTTAGSSKLTSSALIFTLLSFATRLLARF